MAGARRFPVIGGDFRYCVAGAKSFCRTPAHEQPGEIHPRMRRVCRQGCDACPCAVATSLNETCIGSSQVRARERIGKAPAALRDAVAFPVPGEAAHDPQALRQGKLHEVDGAGPVADSPGSMRISTQSAPSFITRRTAIVGRSCACGRRRLRAECVACVRHRTDIYFGKIHR